MTIRRIGAAALAVQFASAFKDTSPFFLFSTSSLFDSSLSPPQLASASSIDTQISKALSSCPSDTYIIISQPGVAASDFASAKSSPNLRHYLNKTAGVSEAWVVPEVAGVLDAKRFEQQVEKQCKADVLRIDATTGAIPNEGVFPRLVYVQFQQLPTTSLEARAAKLAEHDSFLHAVISELASDNKYTVIYTTSPPSAESHSALYDQSSGADAYEMDDPYLSVLHTEMRRDFGEAKKGNDSNLGLFDKYQYTSPGIFMGLSVFLLLLMILYVGISAVASLQVSYFAFSKEMGPSAQKKQQ